MPDQIFEHSHRVTYRDCTVGNHIYYSRYLDLLEEARGEFFRRRGVSLAEWQARDTAFPVLECRVRYRHPARYDDLLRIQVWITLAKGARLNFGHRILNQEGALVVEGETWHACAGLDERPKRLPRELCPEPAPPGSPGPV